MEMLNSFLHELKELYEKYDIIVNACGCCNSPFLDDYKINQEKINDAIKHLREEEEKESGNK